MLPGELFGTLWLVVVEHQHEVRIRPWHGRQAREHAWLLTQILSSETAEVPSAIEEYLRGGNIGVSSDVTSLKERGFVVMCALDDAAMYIHPAIKSRMPGASRALPGMLARMKQDRTANGAYAKVRNQGYVLPKGHLAPTKSRTDFDEQSGADLAHQFSYLSFIPDLSAGQILTPIVVPPSKLFVKEARANFVGVAPIAEDSQDLTFSVSTRLTQPFLDTSPQDEPLSDRISETVTAMINGGAGLVVLPELVAGPISIEKLKGRLTEFASIEGALVIAGSGPSQMRSLDNDRPYNEAIVFTAFGEELYRQRKLNPFNMDADRMEQCNIQRAAGCENRNHLEDCAMGQELVVCDVIGLGRVVILICEDIEQDQPGGTVCSRTFPDWIVTPILDVKLEFGRWTHRRAIEIARKTRSRVVVSSSATLTVRKEGHSSLPAAPPNSIATGLFFDGSDKLKGRFVKVGGTASGRFDVVEWRTESWTAPWIVPSTTTP